MKKNKMMRIASVLLVATLLSTCVISGTFAKYVTSGSSTDKARVAKFGVKVIGSDNLFWTDYYAADDNTAANEFTGSVDTSITGEKIVAPGTKGSLAKIQITGTPEVKVEVSFKAESTVLNNWFVNEEGLDASNPGTLYYCPLVFTIGGASGTPTIVDGKNYIGNQAGLVNKINAAIDGVAKEYYNALTDLSTVGASGITIDWEWPFSVSDLYDKYDTYLGDQAALGNAAVAELTFSVVVTQID